jgi:hypothetical protein
MSRRTLLFFLITLILATTGCIKETYDMNKLSKKVHLSPTLAISAIKGDISLLNMVKSNDTLIFDENLLGKIVFKKESVINLKLADFYDFGNMVSYSHTYTVGDLSLDPFLLTKEFSLGVLSDYFPTPLHDEILLNNNTQHPFPALPSIDIGEKTFSFSNFENAVFRSGFIDISVTNNLNTPLNSISVKVFNTIGHTPIGNEIIIPPVDPGQSQTASINLADETVTNSIITSIVLAGSPGTGTTPVLIDTLNSNIQITIHGRNLVAKSGRMIIPQQTITSFSNNDTITFDPGTGIEVDKLSITTGNLSYRFQSSCPLKVSFGVSLPTVLRSGNILSELIDVNPNSITNGTIPVNNTIFDLSSDPEQPFNRVPMETSVVVESDGSLVNFNSTDEIQFDLNFPDPVFDYIKGYFGEQVETIQPDSIDFDIADIINHITGDFHISSPSITLNYINSFSIPVQIALIAEGKKKAETVNLGLAPFILEYPVYPPDTVVSASYVIDKNNSSLPDLISMPPEKIRFSGSAKMNPDGKSEQRNYVFGKSRLFGSLDVEVPLDFWFNNLQFADTVKNFLKDNSSSNDNPIKPENFELFRVDITAKNGFPLGVSLKMSLYDSVDDSVTSTVVATNILEPAPVDTNGKATGTTETSTSIEFTSEFFKSIDISDKIIFKFTLNTTGNGTKDVKLYSDYRIDFNASLVLKPDITLK